MSRTGRYVLFTKTCGTTFATDCACTFLGLSPQPHMQARCNIQAHIYVSYTNTNLCACICLEHSCMWITIQKTIILQFCHFQIILICLFKLVYFGHNSVLLNRLKVLHCQKGTEMLKHCFGGKKMTT